MSKAPPSSQAFLLLALIVFFLLGLLAFQTNAPVKAQTCTVALNKNGTGAWPQGTATNPTVVWVYLDSNQTTGWTNQTQINAL